MDEKVSNQGEAGTLELEVIDIEEYCKAGKHPPKNRRYRIKIDKEKYVVEEPFMTGRDLLRLAGKEPPEEYEIFQKLSGGKLIEISLNENADFTKPGIEKFVTLPLDQGEG